MIEVPARPHFRQVGDRCRDFVIALTPHPITRVRKCRAAILNLDHAPVVVLCTLTSTRMRHSRNQVVENQNSQLGPHRLGEGGDDHKERWYRKARTIGAKLKSQSRGVLNPPFQIETIDGPLVLLGSSSSLVCATRALLQGRHTVKPGHQSTRGCREVSHRHDGGGGG